MAGPAYSTTWPAAPLMPIWPIVPRIRSLAVTPRPSSPVVEDPHRLRAALRERLRGQHVLDLARADAERQRAERAVRGGVRVAADDRHARLGDAQLGPDDVDDPAPVGAERVERDAELLAVALERLDLRARELVVDARGDRRAVGGHVVVGGGERAVGPAHGAAGEPQALEGLRAGHLVDEVQVDVEQAGRDLVRGPDLVEQRRGGHERRSPADTTASRTASSFPGFSKWCGRSASNVTASPACSSWRAPSTTSSAVPGLRRARSRASRARASAGRRGRRSTRRARAGAATPRRAGRAAAA